MSDFQDYGVIVALVIALSSCSPIAFEKACKKDFKTHTRPARNGPKPYRTARLLCARTKWTRMSWVTDRCIHHMLIQIQEQNSEITSFNQNLEQKSDRTNPRSKLANKELKHFPILFHTICVRRSGRFMVT